MENRTTRQAVAALAALIGGYLLYHNDWHTWFAKLVACGEVLARSRSRTSARSARSALAGGCSGRTSARAC
jgi:hypothetical protein